MLMNEILCKHQIPHGKQKNRFPTECLGTGLAGQASTANQTQSPASCCT
jgi:hypothetical protein